MGIEEVFIDPCPGCEDVVPGIVTPGGPPSPQLTRRWGGIQKKKPALILVFLSLLNGIYLMEPAILPILKSDLLRVSIIVKEHFNGLLSDVSGLSGLLA